jgi:hypothetical protein
MNCLNGLSLRRQDGLLAEANEADEGENFDWPVPESRVGCFSCWPLVLAFRLPARRGV